MPGLFCAFKSTYWHYNRLRTQAFTERKTHNHTEQVPGFIPYNRLYTLGTHKTPPVLLNTIIKMHFMLFPSLIKTAFFYFFVKGFAPSLCIMQTANLTEVKCIDSEEWHLIFTSVKTKGDSTDLLNQPVNDELKSHRLGKGALCR